MNIRQTAQILAYIASTHPNYPRYTDEDKQRVVMAYFRLLWPYSITDVMEAVDKASRKSRPYPPGAYDIEAEITPHYETDKYIDNARIAAMDGRINALEEEQRNCIDVAQWRAKQAQIDAYKAQIAGIYKSASEEAKNAYQERELALATPELKSLCMEA